MPQPEPTPKLSVVVPFYDVESYIDECLASIARQLLEDVEVVLVDDGSTDGSRDIAQRYVDSDPRFRLVTQSNAGLGPARNTGAAQARGEYLTFVDSDDVVAPRGFWALVSSLDESGSDFAAGNARRFTRARGSYQSWSHADAFARGGRRVTIAERPELAKDRMVWNKVYRRSFWDEHEFVFPAIRYEDYPVTLRAYLEAEAVDVLPEHVYYWRDRESGTSITQQTADMRNAAERYASASMVLDVLDTHPSTSPAVGELVHATFARVDLASMAQTYATCGPDDRRELAAMMRGLASRLDPDLSSPTTRLSRLVLEATRRGDLALVEAVGRRQAGGSLAAFGQDILKNGTPVSTARLACSVVAPSGRGSFPRSQKPLRARLVSADRGTGGIELEVDAAMRSIFARAAHFSATINTPGEVRDLPVTVVGHRTNTVSLRVTLSDEVIAGILPGRGGQVRLSASLPLGARAWSGPIAIDADGPPGPLVSGPSLVQLTSSAEGLMVDRPEDPLVVRCAGIEDGVARLALPPGTSHLVISGRAPLADVELPITLEGDGDDDSATLNLAEAFSDDAADDPIMGDAERPLMIRRKGESPPDPVLLEGEPLTAPLLAGGQVRVTRGPDGHAVLRLSGR